MGLFDLFFKNRDAYPVGNDGEPYDSKLEELLYQSATDRRYEKDFYECLCSSELFVLTDEEFSLNDDAQLELYTLKDSKIPVFSSPVRIYDQGVIDENVKFATITGRDLFTRSPCITFILNPFSGLSKELLPAEIGRILKGDYIKYSENLELPGNGAMLVQAVDSEPRALVKGLKKIFSKNPDIKSATLSLVSFQGDSEPPRYTVFLELDGELEDLLSNKNFSLEGVIPQGEYLDFGHVRDISGLAIKPFYRKK